MKTIGLLGGMSWESTVTYYQIINEIVKQELGGLHSAKVLIYSVDFAEIEKCQADGDWEKSADILSIAAKNLEKAGADFIVICTNTMHIVASQIQSRIGIPIIHIAEATAIELKRNNIAKVALLGTRYTMSQDFYKEKLKNVGVAVLIPCFAS
jgi:aspartate racemase